MIAIEIPIDIEDFERGRDSQERATQEQREESALGALYLSLNQTPTSPAEPSHIIPDSEVDAQVQTMTVGPELEPFFWNPPMPPPDVAASLVEALMSGAVAGDNNVPVPPLDPNAAAALSAIPPEQLQSLLQQLNPVLNPNPGMMSNGYGSVPDPSWGNPGAEYGYPGSGPEESYRGGGRGRGRGRGRGGYDGGGHRTSKRKPCSFFQAGRRALNQRYCAKWQRLIVCRKQMQVWRSV